MSESGPRRAKKASLVSGGGRQPRAAVLVASAMREEQGAGRDGGEHPLCFDAGPRRIHARAPEAATSRWFRASNRGVSTVGSLSPREESRARRLNPSSETTPALGDHHQPEMKVAGPGLRARLRRGSPPSEGGPSREGSRMKHTRLITSPLRVLRASRLLALGLALGVLLAFTTAASARVLRVAQSHPPGTAAAQFRSIQAAVDAARPGDWILSRPATTTSAATTPAHKPPPTRPAPAC